MSIAPAAAAFAEASAIKKRRLRVVFCTRGGFFGERVLAHLLTCDRINLCGMVRSSRVFNARYGFLRGALAYLRNSGILYSLYLLCATDVADAICAMDRAKKPRAPHFPVHTTRDLNDTLGVQFLSDCAPDVLISAFFDQRLHEQTLHIPTRGCVNIHPSLLPDFRGVDPVLQARLQGRRQMGVTVHYMTPALDAGNLLAQQTIDTGESASVFETTARLFDLGAKLLTREALAQVERGDPGTPQPQGGSYESWPTPAEIRMLRASGRALLRPSDFRDIPRQHRSEAL